MNVYEYQAKFILSRYGIPVPDGGVATSALRAKKIAMRLGGDFFVVKAQIHAGGRGKAGGVQVAHSPEEVHQKAKELLGKRLVTPQTGPEGKKVRKVLVEKGERAKKEYYVGLTVDRSKERISIMASTEGGMDIEDIVRRDPSSLLIDWADPVWGITDYKARRFSKFLGVDVTVIVKSLYKMFVEYDCYLCEINPLALTEEGRLVALDAKVSFDDNALFRQNEVRKFYDPRGEDPREAKAREIGVSYVGLDGNIGCLVNGAGLAMATMDEILLAGGMPANFLDIGGGASEEQIRRALSLLLSDKRVKVAFINIFGGIMRCDAVASSLVQILKGAKRKIPVVVRLEGTNHEIGMQIISRAGLDNVFVVASMKEGALMASAKAIELSSREGRRRKERKEEDV